MTTCILRDLCTGLSFPKSKLAMPQRLQIMRVVAVLILHASTPAPANADPTPKIAGITLGMSESEVLQNLRSFDASLAVHIVSERAMAPPYSAFDSTIVTRSETLAKFGHEDTIVVKLGEFTNKAFEVMRYKEFDDDKEPQALQKTLQAVAEKYGLILGTVSKTDPFYSGIKIFGPVDNQTDKRICETVATDSAVDPSYMFSGGAYVFQTDDVKDKQGKKFSPISDSDFLPWRQWNDDPLPGHKTCGVVMQVDVALSLVDKSLVRFLRQHMFDPQISAQESRLADKSYADAMRAQHQQRMIVGNQAPKL